MRQERSRRLARAVLWRPGRNRTSKSRLPSSSNSRRTGREPSALTFLHRSDLPHEACVKSVLEDSPARYCDVRERSGRANPAFSLRATCNALAERLPLRRSSIGLTCRMKHASRAFSKTRPRGCTGQASQGLPVQCVSCPVRFCSFRPMKVPLQKWDKVRQLGKSNYPATRGGFSGGETWSCFGVSIELDFRRKNNRDPVARQAGDPGYTFRNILAAPLSLTG